VCRSYVRLGNLLASKCLCIDHTGTPIVDATDHRSANAAICRQGNARLSDRQRVPTAITIPVRVLLLILRNLLPFAGYTWWSWSANDVVLLGAFNLQSVFTFAGVSACLAPRLVKTDLSKILRWSCVAVVISWAAVFVAA
jgi:hypothetical protein